MSVLTATELAQQFLEYPGHQRLFLDGMSDDQFRRMAHFFQPVMTEMLGQQSIALDDRMQVTHHLLEVADRLTLESRTTTTSVSPPVVLYANDTDGMVRPVYNGTLPQKEKWQEQTYTERKLPPGKTHFLSITDLLAELHMSQNAANANALRVLMLSLLENPQRTLAVAGGEVRAAEAVIVTRNHNQYLTFFVDPRIIPVIRSELGHAEDMPDTRLHWMSLTDTMIELKKSKAFDHDDLSELEGFLHKLKERFPNRLLNSSTGLKARDCAEYYRTRGQAFMYVNPEALNYLKEHFLSALPDERQHWLRGSKLCKALHLDPGTRNVQAVDAILRDLWEQFNFPSNSAEVDPRVEDGVRRHCVRGRPPGMYLEPSLLGDLVTAEMVRQRAAKMPPPASLSIIS